MTTPHKFKNNIIYKMKCEHCGNIKSSNYIICLVQTECTWCDQLPVQPTLQIYNRTCREEIGILHYNYDNRTIDYDFDNEIIENELKKQLSEWYT